MILLNRLTLIADDGRITKVFAGDVVAWLSANPAR